MFSFMGAEVLAQVIRDLMPLGLESARSLLLAGSSAGGTGVMLNLDRIHNLVHHELGMSRSERDLSIITIDQTLVARHCCYFPAE